MIYLVFLGSLAIAIAYAFVIMQYLDGWNETPEFSHKNSPPQTTVSVIIAVYNEEKAIYDCVASILKNTYPTNLWELIIIDNGSTDNTIKEIQRHNSDRIRIISEPLGYKKEALEAGISAATNSFILCTDGDCLVQSQWIHSMVLHHEIHKAEIVLGPVEIRKYRNLLTRFQAFDMLAMMGITAGGLKKGISYLSNGANMAFTRNMYNSIGSIPRKDIPSGDDVFLLHEYLKQGGDKVYYNRSKEAIVKTEAQSTWKGLIEQRKRWASKTMSYVNPTDRYVAAFIFLFCMSIVINLLLTPFTGGLSFFIAIFQLFIKATIDYAFLSNVNNFFKKKHLMRYFLPSFFVHFSYILFAGIAGLMKTSYDWRGKKV